MGHLTATGDDPEAALAAARAAHDQLRWSDPIPEDERR
jgi:hypothetical protein